MHLTFILQWFLCLPPALILLQLSVLPTLCVYVLHTIHTELLCSPEQVLTLLLAMEKVCTLL